jgi:DNA polymerase III epsilon subunit family exonuclease
MKLNELPKVNPQNPEHRMLYTCFCAIDFETTGLFGASDEVIEFAAVRVCVDPGTMEAVIGPDTTSLCRPSRPIPAKITQLTGITDAMARGHPPFGDRLPGLLSFIGDAVVVAHNVPFDLSFLLNYCQRGGHDFRNPTFCTLSASRRLFPELASHRLSSVAERLGIKNDGWHRAMGDAMTTAVLFSKIWKLSSL